MQAAKRIVALVAAAAGITIVGSALVGALFGADLDRAVSAGLYVVGCLLVVLGVFSGLRGPVRPRGGDEEREPVSALFGVGVASRGARTATSDERADAHATAWLFIGLGMALIAAGVVADSRVGLT